MDTSINSSIIEKVVTKKVTIFKAISMLPPPPFEDKFATKETLCQQNEITQKTNSERCLNELEQKTEQPQNDITNEIEIVNEQESWRTITDPKLRKKMRLKAYHKAWYEANRDIVLKKQKKYNDVNKDKRKIYIKKWREKNKDEIKLKTAKYYIENKDVISKRIKTYVENNKDIVRYRRNKYERRKTKDDIQFRIGKNLRRRLRNSLHIKTKSGSAVRDLGCSIDELKSYLESKFQPGMTWDNYGYHGWHIDHIKPLASFDLTDRNQLLNACHYTNLQPLWAKDNLKKWKNY